MQSWNTFRKKTIIENLQKINPFWKYFAIYLRSLFLNRQCLYKKTCALITNQRQTAAARYRHCWSVWLSWSSGFFFFITNRKRFSHQRSIDLQREIYEISCSHYMATSCLFQVVEVDHSSSRIFGDPPFFRIFFFQHSGRLDDHIRIEKDRSGTVVNSRIYIALSVWVSQTNGI